MEKPILVNNFMASALSSSKLLYKVFILFFLAKSSNKDKAFLPNDLERYLNSIKTPQ